MVIPYVLAQNPAQMLLVEGNYVVRNLPPATPDPALRQPFLARCLHARPLRFHSRCRQESQHLRVEFSVALQDHVLGRHGSGNASRSCCTIHSTVGCWVTLQCRILRRSCSMTKKQYSTRKVTVGTVKKSMGARTSR